MTKEEIAALSPEERHELLEMLQETEATKTEETPKENPEENPVVEPEKKPEEQIVGGEGDGKSLEDIAKIHNVPVEDLKAQLENGIKVEMEHTSDPKKAEEIAKDHLTERPDYYVQLAEMEKKAIEEKALNQRFDAFGKGIDDRLDERFNDFNAKLSDFAKQFQDAMKANAEKIESLTAENAELRRRQPTGFPGPVIETRAQQTPQEQKTKEVANGYFKGYRTY